MTTPGTIHKWLFNSSEAIGRGENCPSCGAGWQPDTDGPAHEFLQHVNGCEYVRLADAEDNGRAMFHWQYDGNGDGWYADLGQNLSLGVLEPHGDVAHFVWFVAHLESDLSVINPVQGIAHDLKSAKAQAIDALPEALRQLSSRSN